MGALAQGVAPRPRDTASAAGAASAPAARAAAADWAPAARLFVGVPARGDVWRCGGAPARHALRALVAAAAPAVPVALVADAAEGDGGGGVLAAEEAEAAAAEARAAGGRAAVVCVAMDDCWLRDTGPVYCRGRAGVEAVSFNFNAWGGAVDGCYSEFGRDRGVGRALASEGGVRCVRRELVLEGGSISCDGEGTLITTEECLLHGHRNAGVTKHALETEFRDVLGVTAVLWLPFGVARDSDTSGHVDNMCVFVGPGHVALHWAHAADDAEQHRRSAAALRVLESATDARGRALTVHLVHAPRVPVVRSADEAAGVAGGSCAAAKPRRAGERLAASYVNFVFAGDAVLVPSFGVSASDDARALREVGAAVRLAHKHVGRRFEVAAVPAREFVLAGGGLHCMTVAEPRPP